MTARAPALAALLLLVACLAMPGAAKEAILEGQPVVAGLNGPVDIAILPDGSIWWAEYYSGDVVRQAPDGTRTTMFHADPMPERDERGLVGLAVDAESWEQKRFFVYYTVYDPEDPEGGTNRLSRIDDGKETVLLTTTASFRHNGGRIVITPERHLFVSTGENNLGHPAQDPKSLLGKVLRVDQDGNGVAGNMDGRVYSIGHRNVYGLAYDPAAKRLFATENGNAERDEVNEIMAGKNYGWPKCEGHVEYEQDYERDTDRPCTDPAFTPPIGEYYPTKTAAPTGAAILHGTLYWASWNEGAIHRLAEEGGKWVDTVVYDVSGRMNDLEAAPDGSGLYYSNWTHIVRVDFPEGSQPAAVQASPQAGSQTAASSSKGAPAAGLLLALAGLGVAFAARRRKA